MTKLTLSQKFAEVSALRRKAVGMTQEELAAKAGVHRTYIGDIENARKSPTLDVAEAIAIALGVALSQLIADAERGHTK